MEVCMMVFILTLDNVSLELHPVWTKKWAHKILYNLKETATQQRRADVTFFPPELDHLKMVESVVLPDGTI